MSDLFTLSDEDFIAKMQSGTSALVGEIAPTTSTETPEATQSPVEQTETPLVQEETQETETTEETTAPVVAPEEKPEADTPAATTPTAVTDTPKEPEPKEGEQPKEPAKEATPAQATPNYEEFYKQIMAPFKANGRTVELKTPDEAIKLMQMGANFTKKMQELAPHRKVLMMLENNGLLDEGKLSYLIDLDKKNPEAIKKLVKDAGVDPMEIDTTAESAYREGNHRVSDKEVLFRGVLDDLKSTPEGMETLRHIHTDWDQASKDALLEDHEALNAIHVQRSNGIYARISAEVDRRKLFNEIPPNVPFVHAYKHVGDQMMAANAFADLLAPKTMAPPPVPVVTRVAAPKPTVTNNEKAQAAAPTRTAATKAKEFINPLSMSDDEFLKQMANRV